MKKALVCALLALALAVGLPPLYAALRARARGGEEPAATRPPASPEAQGLADAGARDTLEATLYFRFGESGTLGAQRATIDLRRDELIASVIVRMLLDGPDAAHASLTGLFPQGTRLLSVSGDGETAFVTLSSAFLGRPDGAPQDWEDSADWQREAAQRRELAVQSIVLALTEGARYQRVQLFVADSDDDAPRRIPLCLLDPDETDASLVLGACGRDESALLTPMRAMEMVLAAWRARDWAALYALLYDEEGLPSLSAFEQEMAQADVTLLSGALSGGGVSLDGRTATLVLDAQTRSPQGGDAQLVRESVPLARVHDNWALSLTTLRGLMVRE